MNVDRQIAYWRDGAAEDYEAALALLEKGRTRHALFFAELSLEKMLKAHVVKVSREIPPRTHDLLRLASLAELPVDDEQRRFLAQFQEYCLEGRYPESFSEPPERAEAEAEFEACQRMLQWLTNRFE